MLEKEFFLISRFMLFSTLKTKYWKVPLQISGGGVEFFLEKQFFLVSRFMLFSTLQKNNIEKCPFTYWLNGRWFLQIVHRDSGNLSNIILYSLVLIFDLKHIKCGGGGNIFLAFYAIPTFIEKINYGNKKQWESISNIYINKKLGRSLLNLLAGDLGWLSCLVHYFFHRPRSDKKIKRYFTFNVGKSYTFVDVKGTDEGGRY